MARERAGHLGEGHFNQVQPGAMLRRMDILKAARPCCQIGHGFLGHMRAVVIENNPNSRIGGIMSIKALEQLDEFTTAMAFFHFSEDMPVMQIERGENA